MAELVVMRRRHERRIARREAVRRMEASVREIEREAPRRIVIDQMIFQPRLAHLPGIAAALPVAGEDDGGPGGRIGHRRLFHLAVISHERRTIYLLGPCEYA